MTKESLGIIQLINPAGKLDKQILLFENEVIRNSYWRAFTDKGREERRMKKCKVIVIEEEK